MILRDARPEDCAELTDLVFRAKASNGYDAAFMEACRDELRVTDPTGFRVAEAEALLGCARRKGGRVSMLFIAPEAQRRGVGRALWDDVIQSARAEGLTALHLDADPEAVPFYTAMGCVQIGESPSGSIPGRMLPLMECVL